MSRPIARAIALVLLTIFVPSTLASLDEPDLKELRATLADASIPIAERTRRVLDAAATLDQSAQEATQATDRRTRWSRAVGLLDDFLTRQPDLEAARLLRFHAGVYRWAEGRSFAEQAELTPAEARLRDGAVRALDDAVDRLRKIETKPAEAGEPFAQNLRFRLAQAIADRAKLDPDEDPGQTAREREALAMLDDSLTTPGLRPFARLLRAELDNRLGLFGQAQIEVDQAAALKPPPPAEALLELKVTALNGRAHFEEASKAIEAAKLSEPFSRLMDLRVSLSRRRQTTPGPDRDRIDAEAFRKAEKLRGVKAPEALRGSIELARTIDEPGANGLPEWWDLLAEGHLGLGDPVRAGRLETKGADAALALGQADLASTLRFKAGACLFEANRFGEADRQLTRVVETSTANPGLRARAGMLRVLARGRALASHEVGASTEVYLAGLVQQVRDFPKDPATGEARWLLAQIRQTAGRLDEARELLGGIVHGHPRWLEARVLISERLREGVETQRINRDAQAIASKMDSARSFLKQAINEAIEGPELTALLLQSARLELIPESGRPALALEAADKVLRQAARPEEHQAARLDRLVALAQGGRAIEAEKAARAEVRTEDLASLLPAIRLLDRSASESEAEASRRRFGLIARIFTQRIAEKVSELSPPLQEEIKLRDARALLFSGDTAGARRMLAESGGLSASADDRLLRDLADTYQRLDAHALAIDAERYRSSRLTPGTLPWFESRYGMALAYYRSDRAREARHLIDATAILHPDLGGGELKTRFERLRQRIGSD